MTMPDKPAAMHGSMHDRTGAVPARQGVTADKARREADRWAERAERYRGTPIAQSCRMEATRWAKIARERHDAG